MVDLESYLNLTMRKAYIMLLGLVTPSLIGLDKTCNLRHVISALISLGKILSLSQIIYIHDLKFQLCYDVGIGWPQDLDLRNSGMLRGKGLAPMQTKSGLLNRTTIRCEVCLALSV